MKLITQKKECIVKKKASKINFLADSLYFWVQELKKSGLVQEDPFLYWHILHDAKELKEEAEELFWKEL